MSRIILGWTALLALAYVGDAASQPDAKNSMASEGPRWPTEILGKKLEMWVNEIRDDDPSVREEAIQMVHMFGPKARKAASKYLIASLDDTDVACKVYAIIAVGQIGFDEKADMRSAVTKLTTHLRNPQNSAIRYQSAMALGRLGPDAAAAIGELCAYSIRDTATWEIRRAAAFALGRIAVADKDRPADRRAHVALAGALNDKSSQVRREVVQSLLVLGRPSSPEDIAVLKTMITAHALRDKDKSVAIWSRVCLMRLSDTEVTEDNLRPLANLTKSKDPSVVLQATQALGVVGSLAKPMLPDLVAVLDHSEPLCVVTACWAISQFGTDGDKALPKLTELVKSKDEAIKYSAEDAVDIVQGKRKPNEPRPVAKVEPKLEVPKLPPVVAPK